MSTQKHFLQKNHNVLSNLAFPKYKKKINGQIVWIKLIFSAKKNFFLRLPLLSVTCMPGSESSVCVCSHGNVLCVYRWVSVGGFSVYLLRGFSVSISCTLCTIVSGFRRVVFYWKMNNQSNMFSTLLHTVYQFRKSLKRTNNSASETFLFMSGATCLHS